MEGLITKGTYTWNQKTNPKRAIAVLIEIGFSFTDLQLTLKHYCSCQGLFANNILLTALQLGQWLADYHPQMGCQQN